VSIDHGVMEHLSPLAVVPGDFGWSDVGSWQSAWELAAKDEGRNAAPPGTVLVDATGNHVVDLRAPSARKRVIALVGVEDLVVVETDDALLVVPRARAQDVKVVVDRLKARGDGELT
jgi:mannose-1-phosphate guanylyltransferase